MSKIKINRFFQEPLEDYSKDYKKAVVKEIPANSKQKALAKSAAGSKNIMSFFAKKWKWEKIVKTKLKNISSR